MQSAAAPPAFPWQVARWVREVRAEPGYELFEQGAAPYEMFVIESGSVEVLHDGEVLATLGPSEPVGETSLLRQERRMATVRAASPMTAVAIRGANLLAMKSEMPEIVDEIRAVMEERLQRNTGPDED